MKDQEKDLKLHLFKKTRFEERESINLRVHKTDTGISQCQQGFHLTKMN